MHPPSNLRCEYLTNPLGIEAVRPRLSWELRDPRRGAHQTAFQVQLDTAIGPLLEDRGTLRWDSGQCHSQETAVVYDGPPLGSAQRAVWRVRTWDSAGQPSPWSELAWWETGLLDPGDWQAIWIGGPLVGGPQTTSPAPFLRTSFTLDQPHRSARLYVTALGLYECYLNGQRVGDQVFCPGWTDYATRVQYQVYDVSELLEIGENALGAILGDGWYCGHVEWRGRQRYGDRPKLLAQLIVTADDGSRTVISSGADWRVAYGPILESDLLMGESYDARRELGAWSSPGYAATHWMHVETFADPGIVRSAMRGPAVRQIAEIKPIAEPRELPAHSGRWIFDLGQNMVGRVRLKMSGVAGTSVTLNHAEVLDASGDIYTANLRTAKQTDHYTLKGGEPETYEPHFTFHGFRYVGLCGYSGIATRDMITGLVLHSDLAQTGEFSCSNPLLNQLQHNIEWGQRGNFLDIPTDCPQRDERLGWTGDAQVFIRTAAYNMDVAAFFSRWCRDLEDAQTDEGAYPCVVPNTGVVPSDGGPAWADAGIICPWTIWQCYGDTRIIEQRYSSMAKFVAYMREKSLNLIRAHPDVDSWGGFGDWLALDGPGNVEGVTPKELIGTAFFSHSARLLADMAVAIGKTEDAARYRMLAEDVRHAFLRRFVTPEGQIVGNTQTSY
ncbi:MAG: family 78 glycoside hydrolase catalytic domain, partial [Roseiflexaceae bacterium]|nr:family 78 glycoside hydrolase catalytic domain [Roseiflexaceae bacterium]